MNNSERQSDVSVKTLIPGGDGDRFHPNIPDEARGNYFKKEVEPKRKLDFEIWEHKYGWSEKIYG